jgi:tetratricopeptide (TPR) repeat protein
MVGMHAGRAPKVRWVGRSQRSRSARTREVGAGHHLPRDARLGGSGDYLGAIVVEACMRQIRANIDQFYVQAASPTVYLHYMLRGPLRFRSLLAVLLMLVVVLSHAQQGGDFQARILYAFHAEDTNQLANLVQTLGTQVQAGGADGSLRYHLAHAEYRLGLLVDETHAHDAESAFTECIDQLKSALQQDVNSVEALILQSACYANLARFKKLEVVLDRSRAADRLSAAAKLAPRNPRLMYLQATEALASAKPGSAENRRAFAKLQLAVQLFEDSSSTSIDVPGWGHAEAYLELGRQLELRGDFVGARNWIEKSLIVAPDFKAAQRQLASLVRR